MEKKQLIYTAPELVLQDYEQNSVFCISNAEANVEEFEEIGSIEW